VQESISSFGLKSMLFNMRDFLQKQERCDCCGEHQTLGLMIRPQAQSLTDDVLLRMTDELGEETAQEHYEKSLIQITTHECDGCRLLIDEQYFVILALKEDR
jgi:hypothetical protein